MRCSAGTGGDASPERRGVNPDDAFGRILAALYEAALDDTRWPGAAALIEEACGATGNVLAVGERSGDEVRVYFARLLYRGETRHDLAREYFEVYQPHDEGPPRLWGWPVGALVHVPDMYTERELKTSAAYNEGWSARGGRNGLITRLDWQDGLSVVWGVGDPADGEGWNADRVEFLESLLPHIRQFVRVRQALAAAEALGSGLEGLLDNGRIGVVQLDRGGRVLEANAPAAEILRRGDGLIDRDGALDAWLPADRSRLRRLLGRALPDLWGEAPSGGSMTVQRSSGRSRLALHVSPVGDGASGLRRAPGGGAGAGGRSGAAFAHRRPAGGGDARPVAVGGPDGGAAGRGPEGERDRRGGGMVGGLCALADQAGLPEAGRVGAGGAGAPGPGGGRPAPALTAR